MWHVLQFLTETEIFCAKNSVFDPFKSGLGMHAVVLPQCTVRSCSVDRAAVKYDTIPAFSDADFFEIGYRIFMGVVHLFREAPETSIMLHAHIMGTTAIASIFYTKIDPVSAVAQETGFCPQPFTPPPESAITFDSIDTVMTIDDPGTNKAFADAFAAKMVNVFFPLCNFSGFGIDRDDLSPVASAYCAELPEGSIPFYRAVTGTGAPGGHPVDGMAALLFV